MTRIRYSTAILLIFLIADVRTQFFDFFGYQPVLHQYQTLTLKPTIQQITTERTTKRNNRRKHTTTKPITAVSYDSHDLERDGNENHRHISKETFNEVSSTKQSRRKSTESQFLDFNSYSTTVKPVRKTTKIAEITSSHNRNKHRNEYTTRNNIHNDDTNYYTSTRKYDNENYNKHEASKETTVNKHVYSEKPISSNIADEYYNHTNRYNSETVTKTVHTYFEDDDNKNYENNKKRNISSGINNRNDNNNSVTGNANTVNYDGNVRTTKRPDYNNHDYDNNQQSYTTKKPAYSQNNNYYDQHISTSKSDYTNNNYDYGYNNQESHTRKRPYSQNNNNDYSVNQQHYTTKNPYDHSSNQHYTTKYPSDYNQYPTTKSHSNYDNNNEYYNNNNYNYHTTKNPLMHRPGVKPAVVENRPPITNRPVNRPVTIRPTTRTRKPIAVFPRPTDAGSIAFPEDVDSPEVITGPDEDYMSEVEKRRYIEMGEKMCDKYKSLNMKQLQAIPLVPSPEPVQVNISNCAPTNVPLVVGGKVVTINEFPHMALLGWVKLENGGYSWKCGGSLISDQYVLTAAHCAYQERDNTVIIGAPRVVQLGSSYLDDPGALVVRVSAVIRHPKFKAPKSYHDIALVKLVRTVQFSEVIKPACLGAPPPPGQPIIATGWGQTKFAGDQSLELRSVSLPVWDTESCANILGTSRKLPNGPKSDIQVCAGDRRGGKDTCQGDSGGPAQLQEGCIWRVVAVTSLGRSCGAPNTPGLYAMVQRAFITAEVFGGHRNGNQQNHNNNKNNNQGRNNNNNDQQSNSNNDNYNRNNNGNSNNHYRGIHDDENDHRIDYSNNNKYSTTGSNVYSNNQNSNNNNNRNNNQETTTNNYYQNVNEKQTTRHEYDQINHENDFNQQNHESTIRGGNNPTYVGRQMYNNNNNYGNNNNNYENNNNNYENNNNNYERNKYYNYNTGNWT